MVLALARVILGQTFALKPQQQYQRQQRLVVGALNFLLLVEPLLAGQNKTIAFVGRILPEYVETIVLTGGSTYMPLFKDMPRRHFSQGVQEEIPYVKEAAATGAVNVTRHILPTSDNCGRLDLVEELVTLTNAEEAAAIGEAIFSQQIPRISDDYRIRLLERKQSNRRVGANF